MRVLCLPAADNPTGKYPLRTRGVPNEESDYELKVQPLPADALTDVLFFATDRKIVRNNIRLTVTSIESGTQGAELYSSTP